jgi:molybdopterin molybdotransferase
MIQVQEALAIISENCQKMPSKKIKLAQSLGYILAESIYSPIDMPPFRQSAMDGYAFLHSETTNLEVVNTVQAGSYSKSTIEPNQAVRIFTGAYVPDELDTVVMQEHTITKDGWVEISKMPTQFANVRNRGEQVKENELVLESDTLLTPAAIGFLACLGITEVAVYTKPKVAIIVTGNELAKAGKKLPLGKIYESNSVMLEAALYQNAVKKVKIFRVKDSLLATKKVIKKCLVDYDMILISGGISVGDYDFVKESLVANGVEKLFYKINQKPGKPLFFGKKSQKLVFALPGNPASALTCFYVYVQQALKQMTGAEAVNPVQIRRKITNATQNTSGKSLFLKAQYNETEVTLLDGQSSAMLNSFATANGLVYLPYDQIEITKEQEVIVLPF